jgi:hypothetical protein
MAENDNEARIMLPPKGHMIEPRHVPRVDRAKYETRIVAFYDILGWHVVGMLAFVGDASGEGWLKMTTFSDNVVASAEYGKQQATWMLTSLSMTQYLGLMYGCLIRGAITVGSIVHNKHVVFGPALNRAYELEKRDAIFPRIILDPECLSDLSTGWPHLASENGFTFLDPFTEEFMSLTKVMSEVWNSDATKKNPRVQAYRAMPPSHMLAQMLDPLRKELVEPLDQRDWDKIAWLYDRIVVRLGLGDRARDYRRTMLHR